METLIPQFTFFSDQPLHNTPFDPSTIDDLTRLFEIEAYKSWAAAELEGEKEEEEAEASLQKAEGVDLGLTMESAMEEFRRFEEEMERMCKVELDSLVRTAEIARKMGNLMEKAASVASKKYIEAAMNSAAASVKSAWKGISTNKVHPH